MFEVENLNEVTFVHQEQIFNLQDTDEQLDDRITNLENNGSGSSNTTGFDYFHFNMIYCRLVKITLVMEVVQEILGKIV